MIRPKHPNKEIDEAIQYAIENGWRYKESGKSSHSWGRLLCPLHSPEGCSMSIWSTPRNTGNHAKQIMRKVDQCLHGDNDND